MPNKSIMFFYLVVAVFTLIDMAAVIAIVWLVLKVTNSTFFIGIALCLAVIVPYFTERIIERYKAINLSIKRLLLIRSIAFLVIVVFAFYDVTNTALGLLLVAFFTGMIDYFSISTLESKNTKLVIDKLIPSEQASRFMQTSIQIGAFGGAFLGGLIVDYMSVSDALMLIAFAGLFSLSLYSFVPVDKQLPKEGAGNSNNTYGNTLYIPRHVLWVIFSLAMIGFHIGAFNSLVPIVFQKLNLWSGTLFGLISGFAGLGAFLAACTPRIIRNNFVILALILVADAVIVYSSNHILTITSAFFLGYCINLLRIGFRKKLIDFADNDRLADVVATKSTFGYLLMMGLSPLLLTFMTTEYVFGISSARILMIASAVALGMSVILMVIQNRSPNLNCTYVDKQYEK